MKKLILLSLLALGGVTASASVTTYFAGCKTSSGVTLPDGWEFKNESNQTYADLFNGLYFNAGYSGSAYLISPKLSGDVTITYYLAEGYDYYDDEDGSLFVYETYKDGDNYVIEGDYFDNLFSSHTVGSTTTGSFTVTTPTQIAFEIEEGALCSITYTPYEDVTEPSTYKLTMSNLDSGNGSSNFIADNSGNVPVTFTLSVKNTGSEAVTPGTEGLAFTLTNSYAGDLCQLSWTGDVTTIAPDETKTITLTGSFPIALLDAATGLNKSDDTGAYWAKMEVKNTYSVSAPSKWMNIYPWEFKYRLSKAGSASAINEVNFGFVSGSNNTYSLQLVNLGAREMTVTQISTPLGFSVNAETPFTLQSVLGSSSERTADLVITADTETPGIQSGNIEFAVEGLDTPIQLPVAAVIPGGDEYYVNFNDGQAPQGWIINSSLTYTHENNLPADDKALVNTYSSETRRAITPLLHFNAGEKLVFQAYAKYNTSTASRVTVYTSSNRSDWTQIAVVKNNATDGELPFPGRYDTSGYSYLTALGTYFLDMPEGDTYVAFDICYGGIDNIYGGQLVDVDHDLMFTNLAIGQTAMVNYPFSPAFTVKNLGAEAEEAGSYTTTMIIDGETVFTNEETPAIAAGEEASFSFSYTFHETGDHSVILELRSGDYVLATDVKTVNVVEESSAVKKTVGAGTILQNNSSCKIAPMFFWDKKSLSFMVFPQDYLAEYGITPGTTITGISFNGYLATPTTSLTGSIQAWMFPSELEALTANDGMLLMDELTDDNLVYSVTDWPGEYPSTESEIFKFDFDTPYTYNGGNLMLSIRKEFNNYSANFFFVADKDIANRTLMKSNDYNLDNSSLANANAFAQTNFYYELEPANYTGTVVEAETNAPVADALITLTSDDVIYSGTSAEDGTFSVPVLQTSRDYNVEVTANGYNDYTSTASFADGNVVTTIELTPAQGSGIGSVNVDKVNVRIEGDMIFVDGVDAAVLSIFNAAGQMMSRAEAASISIANLNAGVYVLNVKSANGTASVKFVKR